MSGKAWVSLFRWREDFYCDFTILWSVMPIVYK